MRGFSRTWLTACRAALWHLHVSALRLGWTPRRRLLLPLLPGVVLAVLQALDSEDEAAWVDWGVLGYCSFVMVWATVMVRMLQRKQSEWQLLWRLPTASAGFHGRGVEQRVASRLRSPGGASGD